MCVCLYVCIYIYTCMYDLYVYYIYMGIVWSLVGRACQETLCVKRFRGGLEFKAHRFWYLSTLGLRVIKEGGKIAPKNARILEINPSIVFA